MIRFGLRAGATAVAVAIVSTVVPGVAHATTTPSVGDVTVAGRGPGDLVRVSGTGFTPGASVTVSMYNDTVSLPLADATADAGGAVSLPAGTRTPVTAAPGSYWVRMTQADGTKARSSRFSLVPPRAYLPSYLLPGQPVGAPDVIVLLDGLANSPDVARTLTIDGNEVSTRWWSDERAFTDPSLHFAVPADLALGPHLVEFTQAGPTPWTARATVSVQPAKVSAWSHVGSSQDSWIGIDRTAWNDSFDVTVVGAAGDRHPGYSLTSIGSFASQDWQLDGVSAGTATVTAVSRRDGTRSTTTFVVDPWTLTAPAALQSGESLLSPDGRYRLSMQGDGNLVQRGVHDEQVYWHSHTGGHPGARLAVQSDGNVVVYDASGRALWSTGTGGLGGGVRFGFDRDDNITATTGSGRLAWSNFAFGGAYVSVLRAGSSLSRGRGVALDPLNPAGIVRLDVQGDGNVVARGIHDEVLWQTRTGGHPNAYLTLQTDGNLVLYSVQGKALWWNGARGSNARLVAQSDGNIVEYSGDNRALWSTRTHF